MTVTEPAARNGVDLPTLFATREAVRANPEMAQFQFRAHNRWVSGTHSRSTIHGFGGALQELTHVHEREYEADHPAILVGGDAGSTPAEFLLHALAACLTAGIATIAAARGVTLHEVSSTVTGDIDLLGLLGLDPNVRNGYNQIHVAFTLRGDDPDALQRIVAQSMARSAVLDCLTNGVEVSVDATVA